ncbi:zona pellucida sperm-binding protein 4-like [Clavelina lepadiformis]|uniref:zona pellucida sperm-binding protein 4-like n=1 Tax=Clavelina lepadiformis TaxID=159417 RepID=UPI0040431C5B
MTPVCRNAACVDFTSTCPNNCSGNGICNDNGNCHCSDGFAPPDCSAPGGGGSVDSGPPPLNDINCPAVNPINQWTSFDVLVEDINLQYSCGPPAVCVRFELCPFVASGYDISQDLVLYGPDAPYNPLVDTPNLNPLCVVKPEPFVDGESPTGSATLTFDLENLSDPDSAMCGSRVEETDTTISYTYRLQTLREILPASNNVIVRTRRGFVFDFTCTYHKNLSDTAVPFNPEANLIIISATDTATFSVDLLLFRDVNFAIPITANDHDVTVNTHVYATLRLNRAYEGFLLKVERCWITQNNEPSSSPYYDVIIDSCPAEDPLGEENATVIITNCESQSVRFSFLTLYWSNVALANQHLYLFCQSSVCRTCDCPDPQSCNSKKRRRRDVMQMEKSALESDVITYGPLRLIEG